MSDIYRFNPSESPKDLYTPTSIAIRISDIALDTTTPENFANSIRKGITPFIANISDDLIQYIEESVEIIHIGKYRSASIQLFAMGVERLWQRVWEKIGSDEKKWREWLSNLSLPKEVQKYGMRQKPISPDGSFSGEDWHLYYHENEVLVFGCLVGFYDSNVLHSLYHECFKLRCKAAHPTGIKVTPEQVATLLRYSISHMW